MSMSTTVSAAQRHIEEGNRFLKLDRPADAAAEFTMAIRESAPTPNPEALAGRAFAQLRSDAPMKETFAAFAEARPHNGSNPDFMTQSVRFNLAMAESYENSDAFSISPLRKGPRSSKKTRVQTLTPS
jgi:hypothetical protein